MSVILKTTKWNRMCRINIFVAIFTCLFVCLIVQQRIYFESSSVLGGDYLENAMQIRKRLVQISTSNELLSRYRLQLIFEFFENLPSYKKVFFVKMSAISNFTGLFFTNIAYFEISAKFHQKSSNCSFKCIKF